MTEKAHKLLLELYKHPNADDSVEYLYSTDATEKMAELEALQELQDLGYIIKKAAAIGFMIVSITPSGRFATEQL